jgi:hypothetical protein
MCWVKAPGCVLVHLQLLRQASPSTAGTERLAFSGCTFQIWVHKKGGYCPSESGVLAVLRLFEMEVVFAANFGPSTTPVPRSYQNTTPG